MTTNYRELQATLKTYKLSDERLALYIGKLNGTLETLQDTLINVLTHSIAWCEGFEGSYCDIPLHNEVVTRLKTVSLSEMLKSFNPTQTNVPITPVHFVFDDGLCLGHSTSTLFDTYVMHNNAQPIEQHDSETNVVNDYLTRESFNEARELYPTPIRITNNYLHYICLVLAYVYATIYIGCQVTHNLVTVIVQYIIAKRLTSIITATLHDMSFKPFYLDS